MKYTITTENKDKIINLILSYLEEYNVSCTESIYQNDEANLASIDLVTEIVNCVNINEIE